MTSPIQWTAAPYTICALIKKHKANAYNLLKRRLNTDDDNLIMKTVSGFQKFSSIISRKGKHSNAQSSIFSIHRMNIYYQKIKSKI